MGHYFQMYMATSILHTSVLCIFPATHKAGAIICSILSHFTDEEIDGSIC